LPCSCAPGVRRRPEPRPGSGRRPSRTRMDQVIGKAGRPCGSPAARASPGSARPSSAVLPGGSRRGKDCAGDELVAEAGTCDLVFDELEHFDGPIPQDLAAVRRGMSRAPSWRRPPLPELHRRRRGPPEHGPFPFNAFRLFHSAPQADGQVAVKWIRRPAAQMSGAWRSRVISAMSVVPAAMSIRATPALFHPVSGPRLRRRAAAEQSS